jgi:hypothetical protein
MDNSTLPKNNFDHKNVVGKGKLEKSTNFQHQLVYMVTLGATVFWCHESFKPGYSIGKIIKILRPCYMMQMCCNLQCNF